MNFNRIEKLFIYSATGILLFTAGLKIVSAFSGARILAKPEGLFGLPYFFFYLIVATVELVIAGYLHIKRPSLEKHGLVLWFVGMALLYRLGLFLAHVREPCSCLGNAAQWWPWLAKYNDTVTQSMLAYLGLGAALFGLLHWRRRAPTKLSDRANRAALSPS